ncbi:MAG: GntR family transcriptional regulator [Casimicrobiaceae bacterium]
MNPVRASSLVAQVHAEVRTDIAGGAYRAGASLNIAETAKRLGVSATPVREALARLAAEGVLLFSENLGYRVPAPPSAKDYQDWAVARIVVEANALQFIPDPPDPRLLDEAEAINDEIRDTRFGSDQAGVRRYSELNWAFHSRLIALARNATLSDLHARLYAAPQFSRIFLGRGIPSQARIVAEHAAILRPLRRRDRDTAARALREHIVDSLERDARMADVSISLERLAGRRRAASAKPNHPKKEHR